MVERLKDFRGKVIIQTMFMKGMSDGVDVDNTSDRFVEPWLRAVKKIAPSQVMIYTIDRETPDHELRKATHEELDALPDASGKRDWKFPCLIEKCCGSVYEPYGRIFP